MLERFLDAGSFDVDTTCASTSEGAELEEEEELDSESDRDRFDIVDRRCSRRRWRFD